MVWVLLCVLVATGYVEATDDDCSRDTTEVCELQEASTHIRRMVYERNSISCKIAVDSLECVVRVEEKCHFDEDFLSFAKQSLPIMQERCRGVLPRLPSIHTDASNAAEANEDCRFPTDVACKLSDLVNAEGSLLDRCRTLLEKGECMIRVEEKCHFNEYILEMAKNQLPHLQRICGREREGIITSYQRPAENGNMLGISMQCIRKVQIDELKGYCASTPCKFKLIKYAEALIKKEIISDVDINTLTCLAGLDTLTCLAVTVEKKCGHFAFYHYTKLLEAVMPEKIGGECGDLQFNDAFPAMIEVYKENEQAENLLRSVLKTSV